MDYRVEGVKPRSRPKKTWREIVKRKMSDPTSKQVGRCGLQQVSAQNLKIVT